MARSENAKLTDRIVCWILRAYVVVIFALLGLGLWAAAQGNWRPLSYAPALLGAGSMLAYLARAFADASGAYSRLGLLNNAVHIYSLVWLPTIGVVGLWRLTQGDTNTAFGAVLVGGFFWLLGYSTRVSRRRREQAEQAA